MKAQYLPEALGFLRSIWAVFLHSWQYWFPRARWIYIVDSSYCT